MPKKLKNDIVPWKNPAEFIKVYELAYSEEVGKNQLAVEHMAVWETRCWPSLPTAIEATLLFLRSKIRDRLFSINRSLWDTQDVEMMYSNAVVRFLNLLVENDQNTKIKKRMSYLAADRNIPPWIVDIRHNCTHGFNPSLPVLRMAHETIMAYLKEVFWIPEVSRVSCIKKTIDEAPMTELVQDYRLKQYQVVANEKTDTSERDMVLEKIEFFLRKRESRNVFFNVLMRDFITEDDVLSMVGNDELILNPDVLADIKLPQPLKTFYDPLIHLFHKHNLVSTLLELLLLSQEHRTLKVLQKLVDLVVLYVLDLVQAAKGESIESAMPFVHKGANLNVYRILYSCVRGCSSSARLVFERVIGQLPLKEWKEDLSALMYLKMGKTLDMKTKKRKFDETFTAQTLEEDIDDVMGKKNLKSKQGPWFLAPLDINWESLTIGHVFYKPDNIKKEKPNCESETSSAEINDNMYAYAFKESKPVVRPQPTNFIFRANPKDESLIYQRKKEKTEC